MKLKLRIGDPSTEALEYRSILRFYVKGDNTEFLYQTAVRHF